MATKVTKGKPVIVTTEWRGVFFGWAKNYDDGRVIHLDKARMVVQFVGTKSVVGLASNGPTNQCRIGPAADCTLQGVTGVFYVSPAALTKWEQEKLAWA